MLFTPFRRFQCSASIIGLFGGSVLAALIHCLWIQSVQAGDVVDTTGTPALGICQIYNGETCAHFLRNQSVFVAPGLTIDDIEERLKAAYGVIKESK